MSVEENVIGYLLANSTDVTDIVGDGIYHGTIPQDVVMDNAERQAYVAYYRTDTVTHRDLDGTVHGRDLTIQVDLRAATDSEAWDLADAITDALDAVTGTVNGVTVAGIFQQGQDTDAQPMPAVSLASGTQIYTLYV